jgi:GNAT superfamily N-acetyltransferase
MRYQIHEVDGTAHAETIHRFNSLAPKTFPLLKSHHLENGYWWLAYLEGVPVAFAGMVPFDPFPNIGYLKRCYVLPDHHGHGLQFRMMVTRELKARQLGWTHLVSECGGDNRWSANNFRRAGFDPCEPEQRWGEPGSMYWVKAIG